MEKKFYIYYGDSCVLVEKEIYTANEWNQLSPETQIFSNADFKISIDLTEKLLCAERDFLLIQQVEDQEQKISANPENQPIRLRRSKIKREAKDKLTALNQEQTVLLFYYLQKEKVFLKDEYLSDKEAAQAFEILTGYSQNALRQNIGRFNLWLTPPNLAELDNVFSRMKITVGNELKTKKG